jgi:transposase-like protein
LLFGSRDVEKAKMKINTSTENDNELEKIEKLIKEEEQESHPMKVLICPECKSNNVTYYLGGELGYQYRCKDCGYIGAFVLEK